MGSLSVIPFIGILGILFIVFNIFLFVLVVLTIIFGVISVNDFMSCHQTAHTNCHQIA